MALQYYTRTRAGGALPPAGAFTPDGRMHLAYPMQPAAPAASASSGPSATDAATTVGGMLVLMKPRTPDAESAPRAGLLVVLAADVTALAVMLSELRWRAVQTQALAAVGVARNKSMRW